MCRVGQTTESRDRGRGGVKQTTLQRCLVWLSLIGRRFYAIGFEQRISLTSIFVFLLNTRTLWCVCVCGEGGIVKCSSHGHFHLNWRRCRRAAVGTRRRPLNCFTELCTRHSRDRGATPCRGKSTILLFFFQTCWLKRFQVGQFCARASNDRRRDNQVAFFPGPAGVSLVAFYDDCNPFRKIQIAIVLDFEKNKKPQLDNNNVS